MCGIAGIMSFEGKPVFEQELHDMCMAMAHRGPDDEGIYLTADLGLGMRRLSIIDLESGHQPVSNEDGSVWVVLNGEIYNFREQRLILEGRGHIFSTRTDTEIIVHLYEEYGTSCVDHLRGMFAFALWDTRQRRLLLARDRLGIKPLYYSDVDGRLLFASELKAILQLSEVERKLNWSALAHYFSFLTTPPDEAIIDGVRKLEPGHLLLARPGRAIEIQRYWDLHFEPDYSHSDRYFAEQTRDLIEESVRLHMASDVPLGAFLSGGIDSSAIVATAAALSPEPVKTFSIGFREADFNELDYARVIANRLGTDIHELTLGPDALDQMEDLAWYLDEPFGDSSAIPTYIVSKLASQSVKVVLSGDGGDELFAGYDKYVVEQRERRIALSPRLRGILGGISRAMPDGIRGRNFIRHRSLSGAERYLDACTVFRQSEQGNLFRPGFAELVAPHDAWQSKISCLDSGNRHWLSALQEFDFKNYLPLDILTKVDRMSMAHSIETRVPLLDHKLVEFAATIPPEMNLRGGATKSVLKQAMRGILPDKIIDRPKHGFAIPLNYWFRGKLRAFVRDLLLGERSERREFFNFPYIENLLSRHEQGQSLDLHIWTLISFELWARTFLDQGARQRAAA